jgi:hypothetical protein
MKSRLNTKREENRAAAALLLADLEEEFSASSSAPEVLEPYSQPINENSNPITKTRNEPVINPEQTRNKPVIVVGKTRNKDVIGTRNDNSVKGETRNKPVAQPVTNPEQTRNKPVTPFAFASATQFQKEILLRIYNEMQKSVDRMTPPMSLQHFGQSLGKADSKGFESLRIVTLRLQKMGLLSRPVVKNGRGGWTRYSLPQTVYAEIREAETRNEPVINPEQTRNKPVTKPVMTDLSSSRDLIIKESTSTQPVDNSAWVTSIDMSAVEPAGVTRSVLLRCLDLYPAIQPEKLEDLVFRFGEYLKEPKTHVQNARGFFISLAEQLSRGQVPLDHIEAPSERLMREYVERKKEAKARFAEIEQKAFEFELETWLETLTPAEKLAAVPETPILKPGTPAYFAILKNHFAANIWPERRSRILAGDAENLSPV